MQAGLHHISPTHRLIRHLLRPSPAAPKLLSQASLPFPGKAAHLLQCRHLRHRLLEQRPLRSHSAVQSAHSLPASLQEQPSRSQRGTGSAAFLTSAPAAAPWLTLSVRDSSSSSGCLRRALPHAELGTCTPSLPPFGCLGHSGIPYHSSLISAENRDFCGVRGPKLLHGGT